MAEVRQMVASLLEETTACDSAAMSTQQLTALLLCRHESSDYIRAKGPAIITKMRQLLQGEENMHHPYRSDFFYLIMWM